MFNDSKHLFENTDPKKNADEVFTIQKTTPPVEKPLPKKTVGEPHGPEKKKKWSALKLIGDLVLNLVIIVGVIYIVRSFIFAPFQVSGPSMCNTFNFIKGECSHGNGEYLIINKIGYGDIFGWQVGEPQRGDVIIFTPPNHTEDGEFFIKRIIGLPGEIVKIKNGEVYIYNDAHTDGWKLEETYLNSKNEDQTYPQSTQEATFEVPEGEYFVMGDNRRASLDSRRCFAEAGCTNENTPYLSADLIQGKAWVVLWPLSSIRIVEETTYRGE